MACHPQMLVMHQARSQGWLHCNPQQDAEPDMEPGDPWGGLTAEKLLSTMQQAQDVQCGRLDSRKLPRAPVCLDDGEVTRHPKMQKLLKAMPDVRRDYVRELDTALVESRLLV